MAEMFSTAALRLEPGTPASFALDRTGAPIWSRLTPAGAPASRERGAPDAVGQAVRDRVEVAAGCRIWLGGVTGGERVIEGSGHVGDAMACGQHRTDAARDEIGWIRARQRTGHAADIDLVWSPGR
jgi:hypothetical protein